MEDFKGIKQIIKQKEIEITKRTNSGLHENGNFKKLLATLQVYKENNPLTGYFYLIIEVADIVESTNSKAEILFESINNCILDGCNHLQIGKDYISIKQERFHHSSGITARKVYLDLSRDNKCVFVITQESHSYFLDGDEGGNLIFYTKEDQERFEKRREITELKTLFEEYQVLLSKRETYQSFFVSNSGKKSLFKHLVSDGEIVIKDEKQYKIEEKLFLKTYQNLLENKPEDRFRENLRAFLDRKLKGTVLITKEHILETFKRIDIFINDEYGELYLLEVKWIGLSVHSSGAKLGTTYTEKDINPDAIGQTINYISELFTHKQDVKIGYLVVFDATLKSSTEVEVFDENVLDKKIKKFYPRFKRIENFRIVNLHPN